MMDDGLLAFVLEYSTRVLRVRYLVLDLPSSQYWSTRYREDS